MQQSQTIQMMDIVIAEDQRLYREALTDLCVRRARCRVVGETGSGREAMRLCAVHNPYAMILDLHLEDIDGFEVIASLHPSRHKPRFLVTSSHSEEYTLERLERAHVDAFVGKEDGPGEFLEALEALRRGRRYFSASHRARRDARARNPKLASRIMSERESEVLHLVGCGMSDDEIADSLGVARCTAHNHRARIMHKLGITSSPKLVVFAIERGYALWKRTIETVGD